MSSWDDIWHREAELRRAMEPYLEAERQARLWREMSPALEMLEAERQAKMIRDALGPNLAGLHSQDMVWQISQAANRTAKLVNDAMMLTAKPFNEIAYYANRMTAYERIMQEDNLARTVLWNQGVSQAREEMGRTLSAHRLASEMYDLSRLPAVDDECADDETDEEEKQASPSVVEQQIVLPPGGRMLDWARWIFIFSPKSVERVFEPIIADYRHEHIQALAREEDETALESIDRVYRKRFLRALFEEAITQLWNVIKGWRGVS